VSAPGLAELAAAFSHELAEVLTAVSEANTTVEPGSESPTSGVTVTIVVQEGGTGSLHVLVDAEGAALLAKRVLAAEEAVADSDVAEALREVCGQAAAAVVEGFSLKGVRLVATLADSPLTPPNTAQTFQVSQDGTPVATMSVWGGFSIDGLESQVRPPTASASTLAPAPVAPANDPRIDMILDMELPLTVRFGRRELPLKELTSLAPGAVIDLGRSPDDPVEVLVSNQVIARAEVVVVAGNYGVRILDVLSPSDRMGHVEVSA
jgi:flagellar motor switch protein FliN/FliY